MRKSIKMSTASFYFLLLLIFAGCSHTVKMDKDVRAQRAKESLEYMNQTLDPPDGPLTLSDAIARAIKYNLDHRVKLMETAVAKKQLDVVRAAFLPQMAASAGYFSRSNEAGAVSRSLLSGEISLEPSTSQERNHGTTNLHISWDVVDFGLAVYSFREQKNNIGISQERRRKVIQNIIQDVQDAFWRGYVAQELDGAMVEILEQSNEALERSKRLELEGGRDPKAAIIEQREILRTRHNLWTLKERLAQAKIHLAALLNLPPGTDIRLKKIQREDIGEFKPNIASLEEVALMSRPELVIEDYQLKIARDNVRKSILQMFPSIELFGNYYTDDNDFLYNNSWSEVGVQVAWNLYEAVNALGRSRFYKSEEKLAEARHLALSMAVVTQVHLAVNRYELARSKYKNVSELEKVSLKLAGLIERDKEREGIFQKIKAKLGAVSSSMESMLVYAELQNALIRVYNTLGVDPMSKIKDDMTVNELSKVVEDHLESIYQSFLPDV